MDTRSQIFAAASSLIHKEGAAKLTIEAVAKEAGLSKGGVLYHFPSKQKLIEGLLENALLHFEQDMQATSASSPIAAYIQATFEPSQGGEIPVALMAALATDGRFLKVFQDRYALWQQELSQTDLSEEKVMLLRLAADGLWLADMFGLAAPQGEVREKLKSEMLKWARGEA